MAEDPKSPRPGVDPEKKIIRFDYIKSNLFRVIHVDGVFGGHSPNGQFIQMTLWNERWPIPKQTTHDLKDNGELGEERREERLSRNAIVREAEAHLVMHVSVAKQMRDWIDEKLKAYEKIEKQMKQKKPASKSRREKNELH